MNIGLRDAFVEAFEKKVSEILSDVAFDPTLVVPADSLEPSLKWALERIISRKAGYESTIVELKEGVYMLTFKVQHNFWFFSWEENSYLYAFLISKTAGMFLDPPEDVDWTYKFIVREKSGALSMHTLLYASA